MAILATHRVRPSPSFGINPRSYGPQTLVEMNMEPPKTVRLSLARCVKGARLLICLKIGEVAQRIWHVMLKHEMDVMGIH